MDSMHIAAAEKVMVEYFVTCDDDLIRIARRHSKQIKIKVITLYETIDIIYYA